ncbi:unnamed protein product, partial [Amoebophrya sp. A25]
GRLWSRSARTTRRPRRGRRPAWTQMQSVRPWPRLCRHPKKNKQTPKEKTRDGLGVLRLLRLLENKEKLRPS